MATKPSVDFLEAIRAKQQGKRYPVIKLVQENPEMSAILSKLKRGRENPSYDKEGNQTPENPDLFRLKFIADKTANNIDDAQTTMQMLPDIELAAQLLTSVVLSPKDLITIEPTFTFSQDITSPELTSKLAQVIRSYFNTSYDLKKLMKDALREVLFTSGSYPVLVVPENSIDHVINGKRKVSMESFTDTFTTDGKLKSLGLLGPSSNKVAERVRTNVLSNEDLGYANTTPKDIDASISVTISNKSFDTNIEVIDNVYFVKLPKVKEHVRTLKHNDVFLSKDNPLNFSLESEVEKLNDRKITAALFKDRSSQYRIIDSLKDDSQLDRMTIGAPLVMRWPSSAVINAFVPGSPDKHIGHFLLVDIDGNPLDLTQGSDSYYQIASRLNSNNNFASAMLNKAKSSMQGFECSNRDHLDYISRTYGDMIVSDLLSRLRNGKYTNGVTLSAKQEVYRIMLARTLSGNNTQVLWVPNTLMTYFALRYNNDGIGKSLLDDLKFISSLRAMTNMANVMVMLKNSIAKTRVRVKFDDKDPNPQKTLETITHELLRSRASAIPWGSISPSDISDWFGRAGLEMVYEGHPGMPDVGLDFEEKNTSFTQPNTELTDELRKQTAMGLGISPEVIDTAANQPEFAIGYATNNILLSKRAMQIQEEFMPQVTDHVIKIIKNTPSILNDLLNVIFEGFDEIELTTILKQKSQDNDRLKMLVCKETLRDIIDSLSVDLPKPDSVSLENQFQMLQNFEQILDKSLEAYINTDMFNEDTAGMMGGKADTIKAFYKAFFMRKWMVENGVLPELSEIADSLETGEGEQFAYNSQSKIIKSMMKNFTKYLISMRKAKGKVDVVLQKLSEESSGDSSDYSSSSSSSSDTGFDSNADDDFSFDDEPEEEPMVEDQEPDTPVDESSDNTEQTEQDPSSGEETK